MLSPMVGCENTPLLFVMLWQSLSGDSYSRLLSAKDFLASTIVSRFGVSVWDDLQEGQFPSVSALDFVSVFSPMSILFPLLRRSEASTLWSSFSLSFRWSITHILGIPSFWANIHLSVSAYHLCSFVTGLPHSG